MARLPSSSAEEARLIARAIEGDANAFGELYSHNLEAIYRYIYYRVAIREDAEDLSEQVFLKAWEALPGYRVKEFPFSSWLYRIAHNLVVDYHRRSRPVVPIESVPSERLEVGEPNVLTRVIETEEVETLVKAITKLSDEQQQVIVLRFVEGLGHREIAAIIGKNEGACRMIQLRALAALNELLDQT